MAQRVVLGILIQTKDKDKDKDMRKIMRAASRVYGVHSIAIDRERQKLTVIGRMDPAALFSKLRKIRKISVSIESIDPAEEKEEEKNKDGKKEVRKGKRKEEESKNIASYGGEKNLMECLHDSIERLGVKTSAVGGNALLVNGIGNIFIPIISESFVSDARCLSMLEHMVVQRRTNLANTHILPIFFGVKPSDVSPLLSQLHEKFEDKLVNRWEGALIEVADISGWSFPETYSSEEIDNLANSVSQMVLCKLKSSQLSMGNYLVGIDHHVDCILNLLNLEVNDVQVLGIWGQDGVGKTTLARAVYHQLCSGFDACCFLDEIDDRVRHSNGLQFLQAVMVSDLLDREMEVIETVTEGINIIRERFCHMKVLIVLDEIADDSHLKALVGHLCCFGPGSRIIITAQEQNFVEVIPSARSYNITFDLSREHENTLELFSMYAFRAIKPVEEFHLMSKQIVEILDPDRGLPLSAEILGSLLYEKSIAEWKSILKSLRVKDSLDYLDTEKIIKMSYDSLNERQKKIFLDISCFSHGINSRIASSFWNGCLHSPSFDGIEALIQLSLVKIDKNKRIWMHRIVRDFGREIVYHESCLDSISPHGEKQGIEVDASDSHTSLELTLMPNIRFLKLSQGNIHCDFDTVFARLRGLLWQRCSLKAQASDLSFEHIVVLDFSWCKNWTGCHKIEAPGLRVLNLTGCIGLLETPDFSLCPGLEMLILERCSQLVKIDPSVHHLQRLATLNLKYCTELSVLPKEVGYLTALEELHLDGTSIQEIPVLIGHLKNLQILTASNCSLLVRLPHSTCDLSSITELKLDFANIGELPHSIWKRMKLQYLSLRGCRCIRSLPSFAGDVESSLKELDVSGTSISELPLSIVMLKNLRVLKVDFSFVSDFPPNFGELKYLEEIHASWCRNLVDLPNDIGKLESLRVLKVGQSSISSMPGSIRLLTSLETLDCTSCNELLSLPELPSSLTYLHVQSTELKTLPDLVNLKRLRELTLGNDDIMKRIPSKTFMASRRSFLTEQSPLSWLSGSSSLRALVLNLPQIRDLPSLPDSLGKLSLCCTKLKHMPRLPSKLVALSLQDCRLLTKLPLKPLQNLLEMEILHCSKIKKIEGLAGLEELRILKISDCRITSLKELTELTSLTKLTLHDCRLLGDLCVKSLQNLMELEILRCPKIENIEGLEGLPELCTLSISGCGGEMEKIVKNLKIMKHGAKYTGKGSVSDPAR